MKCSFGVRPSPFWAIVRSSLYAVCACLLPLTSAFAWLYPEHRDITLLAINTLGPDRRAVFEKLWSEGRTGHETRLCASTANTKMGSKPACLDYASWPAIPGDHSCSARDMLSTVLGRRGFSAWRESAPSSTKTWPPPSALTSASTPSVVRTSGCSASTPISWLARKLTPLTFCLRARTLQ